MNDIERAALLALDALIWTTGSSDFGPEGKAYKGALKLLYPAITNLQMVLKDSIKHRRTCTCHPDDCPPIPCSQKFALNECKQVSKLIEEPTAYVTNFSKGYAIVEPVDKDLLMYVGMPLYRSSQKRKPLTDKQADYLVDKFARHELIRATEQAHDIGNAE